MSSLKVHFTINTTRAQQYLQRIAAEWSDTSAPDKLATLLNEVRALLDIDLQTEKIPAEVECVMVGLQSGPVRLGPPKPLFTAEQWVEYFTQHTSRNDAEEIVRECSDVVNELGTLGVQQAIMKWKAGKRGDQHTLRNALIAELDPSL